MCPGGLLRPLSFDLAIPAGKVAQVRVRIDWSGASNDFDLFVLDAQGSTRGSSTAGSTVFEETVVPDLPPGAYRVVPNAFTTVNAPYSGSLTLESIGDAPVDPRFSNKLTFSEGTMVDFSANGGEPFIRLDDDDRVFVSAPFGVSTTVSLLWKSVDGGRSFIPLGTPGVRDAVTGPGGGDTHQDFDGQGALYYVDLSAACVTAAVSVDHGETFPPEPRTAGLPGHHHVGLCRALSNWAITTCQELSGRLRLPAIGLWYQTTSTRPGSPATTQGDVQAVTARIEVADLSLQGLATAPALAGGDGLLYLVQWEFGEEIRWVGAEVRAGQPVFYTGTVGLVQTTSKKLITYNPDPVASLQVTGDLGVSAPGVITLRVPRALVTRGAICTPSCSLDRMSGTPGILPSRTPGSPEKLPGEGKY